jgi:sugar/nucleoside kinase (ribokinase family)
MNDDAMKCGLLMETAQTHQTLAGAALEVLQAHTRDLDTVVREEIRRTLMEELQALATESHSAVRSLRTLARAASMRVALWSSLTVTLCSSLAIAIFLAATHSLVPSRSEIAALTARRDELAASIARLEQHGGRIDLRRCGDTERYCVRVDRTAPVFGQKADYLIVAGY